MFILQYPWMKHLSSIFSNETLKDSEEIIVPALPYLQNMTKVIKETPKRWDFPAKNISQILHSGYAML